MNKNDIKRIQEAVAKNQSEMLGFYMNRLLDALRIGIPQDIVKYAKDLEAYSKDLKKHYKE